MNSRLSKFILVTALIVTTIMFLAVIISAQPEKMELEQNNSSMESELITSKISEISNSKICPDLQEIARVTPDEIVSVTITLKEQPLLDVSQTIQAQYTPIIHDIQNNVKSIFRNARMKAMANKIGEHATDEINRNVEIDTNDIISALSETDKQNIFYLNSNFEKTKQEMVQKIIIDSKEKIQPMQQKVKNRIEELGGLNDGEGAFYNVIFSRIPANKIIDLGDLPEVEYIEKTGIYSNQLNTSTYSIHANTFWNNGYFGYPWGVAVADTGIDKAHPALNVSYEGVFHATAQTDPDYADDPFSKDDLHGHGTHIAGIVKSNDSTYRGVANGSVLMNAKFGWNATDGQSYGYWSDAMQAIDWAISTSKGDGAEVISFSFGGPPDSETAMSRYFDALVDSLGVVGVISAGNLGSYGSGTIGDPAMSYNAIAVGAMYDQDTTDRNDDTIASYSSRGPVYGTSRIKPDILAPGSYIKSAAHNWEGANPDFVEKSGTSMAAPHISGAAALLMSTGVYDPREIKALLISTAQDKGNPGPDYDYGWGYVDLQDAFVQSSGVGLGVVNTTNRYGLYKAYQPAGGRPTIVWNRHAIYANASDPATYYSLSDLNLYMYNESDGILLNHSDSNDENVEQVTNNTNTNVILKVYAYNFASGISSETFALATYNGFTSTPLPNLSVNISKAYIVGPSKDFNVSINITNLGDIPAHNVNFTLSLPSGFTITSGSNFYSMGSISAANITNVSSVIHSSSTEGSYSLNAIVSSRSYGESYTVSNLTSILVDATSPIISTAYVEYPTGLSAAKNGTLITLNASISDALAGIKNATVDVSQINSSLGDVVLNNIGGFWKNSTVVVNASDNIYYLNITVYDKVDNKNDSAKISIKVDNTPPHILAAQADYPTGLTAAKNGTIITLNASISDVLAGVKNATINASQINSTLGEVILSNISGFWKNSSVIVNTSDGTYYLNVTAYDNAGNLNNTAQISVIVDNTRPLVSTYPVSYQRGSAANNLSIIGFNVSADDPVINSTSACLRNASVNASLINNTGWITLINDSGFWKGNATFDKFQPDGYYLLNVTFYDNASNMNNSMQINISIDNTPPSVTDVNVSSQSMNVTGFTNITANITSLDAVSQVNQSEVFARITYPNGTSINYNMNNISDSLFYYNFSDTAQYGRFNVTILANDTTGNTNSTQKTWFVTTFISNLSVTTNASNETVISAPFSNTTIRLFTNNTSTGSINITQSKVNLTSNELTNNPGIYVLIDIDPSIEINLSYAVISVNYTDAEVSSLVESSLRLYRWNTTNATSPVWDRLYGAGSPWYVISAGVDTNNNFVWANITNFSEFGVSGDLYVPPAQQYVSSGGGGGGGGGGPSGENFTNIEVKENYDLFIFKDIVTSYRYTNGSNPVMFVNITGNTSAGAINAAVEVLRNTSTLIKPSTPAPGIVYKNVNIWVGTTGFATPKNIKTAAITFKVPNTWLESNRLAADEIRMVRWDGSQWVTLETAVKEKDSTNTCFEATTDTFSPFAITGLKEIPKAVPAVVSGTEAVPAATPTASPAGKIPGFEIVLVTVTFSAAYMFGRKRR